MSRKPKFQKQRFESDGSTSDTSSNIYMSMLLSDAWRALSAPQQRLYIYCKAQYYAEKQKPFDDRANFTMNQSKWCSLYHLYTKNNAKGFYRDMTALIEHGFITCKSCGAVNQKKSVYRFSDAWQRFDAKHPEKLVVAPSDMTKAMENKKAKNKV